MKTIFISLFFFTLAVISTGELIKLENQTHILCATDVADLLISVEPPVVTYARNSTILIDNGNFWDDWSLKNSEDVILPTVLDKRWEDFAIDYTDFVEFDSAVSVSISYVTNSSLYIAIQPSSSPIKETREDSSEWSHFSTYIWIPGSMNDFIPFQCNISTDENSYWKIHNYNIRWAENVSTTPSVIPISPADASCVVLYVYLCSDCILGVRAAGNTFIFQGSNDNGWQSRSFLVNTATNISFSRTMVTPESSVGQWAVDIRTCPPVRSNRTIYEVSLENDAEVGVNRSCHLLGLTKQEESDRSANEDIFSCEPGNLGIQCDIKCGELLGSDMQYCEQHEICEDSLAEPECLCSWGYQETSCDQVCSDGNWGLSCREQCTDCALCDGKTGGCTSRRR